MLSHHLNNLVFMKKHIILTISLLFLGFSLFSQVNKNNIVFSLSDITQEDYLSHDDNSIGLDRTEMLEKKNNSYLISLNNKEIILKDISKEDNPEYTKYEYIGSFDNYLCFRVHYYEISTVLLVNRDYGISTEVYGNIYLSSDKHYLISASQALNYEPFPNNIQLWLINNNRLDIITELNIEDFTPENIKWINNNTIVFEKSYDNEINSWGKITISQK